MEKNVFKTVLPAALLITFMTSLVMVDISYAAVTFKIPIDKKLFNKKAVITVKIWVADERYSKLKTGFDATYEQSDPERFEFSLSDINKLITMKSTKLRHGEQYSVSVSGKSKDECNDSSAFIRGKVSSKLVRINDLDWITTQKTCTE